MARTCAKLGIRLLFAKPYSPEATGKIERFNRVVDAFLNEAALVKPKTLDEFNKLFHVWLDECYQNKPHSALENNTSPESAPSHCFAMLGFAQGCGCAAATQSRG